MAQPLDLDDETRLLPARPGCCQLAAPSHHKKDPAAVSSAAPNKKHTKDPAAASSAAGTADTIIDEDSDAEAEALSPFFKMNENEKLEDIVAQHPSLPWDDIE